jgi:tetratricopeptide (TPR) repeat protein
MVVIALSTYFYLSNTKTNKSIDEVTQTLDRAEKYFEEAGRFNDKRYFQSAFDAIQKVLQKDSLNERALFLMSIVAQYSLSSESEGRDTLTYFVNKIFKINNESKYGFLARAELFTQKRDFPQAIEDLKKVGALDPACKDAFALRSFIALTSGDYATCWQYAKRYEEVAGKGLHAILSSAFLELGDFKEARRQLELKKQVEEFSCQDIESYQKIFLCEGNFNKLEQLTDSICKLTKCEQCPYWLLRAKMHVEKFEEASSHARDALNVMGKIGWRLPAFVLYKVGKKDSALLVSEAELRYDRERLADTTYRQTLPLYSLAAIHAMQNNHQESLKWLREYADKGFEMGSEWYIGHDPLFDEMQKDNEYFTDFIQIVQKAQAKKSAIREKIRALESYQAN